MTTMQYWMNMWSFLEILGIAKMGYYGEVMDESGVWGMLSLVWLGGWGGWTVITSQDGPPLIHSPMLNHPL